MKKELVVGVFVLLGIIGFTATVFVIKDIQIEKGYRLNVYFDDVSNLMEKAWVRIRGVKVGKVETIDLSGEKAKVVIWIKNKVKIYKGTKAKISSTGVLGVKYLELILADASQPVLKDGDEIENAEGVISIDNALSEGISGIKQFSEFFQKFSQNGDLGENLGKIVDNVKNITKKLDNAIDEKQIKNTIASLGTAGESVHDILEPNKENIKSAVLSLKQAAEKVDNLVTEIKSTETVLGQIVSNEETGKKVAETIDTLKIVADQANRTLNRINLFRTYWDYRSRYDTKNAEFKSDIGVEVFPKEKKFYFLSVNNVASEETTTTGMPVSNEKINTVSIGIGGSFYEYFTIYGGLIRSSGGVGLKIFPFGYKSKLLEIGTEIYNFSKSRTAPEIDLSLRLKLTKWLYLGTRYEDMSVNQALNASLNVSFEDEDVGYLFGLIGLSR